MLTDQLFLARPFVTQMSNDVHLLGMAGMLAGMLPPSLCQPCHAEKKGHSKKQNTICRCCLVNPKLGAALENFEINKFH